MIFERCRETCRIRTDEYRGGRLGLQWRNVKFFVTRLEAKGYLDEEWAEGRMGAIGEQEKTPEGDDF